jgi:hypothetical protein
VWDWRGDRRRAAAAGELRAIRRRGLLMLVIGGVAGVVLYRFVAHALGYPVWIIAGVVAAAALASPRGVYPWVDRAVGLLVFAVGRALTLLLLIPLYYVLFASFGLLFRRGRRSKMSRHIDPAAASYWIARAPKPHELGAYERPF